MREKMRVENGHWVGDKRRMRGPGNVCKAERPLNVFADVIENGGDAIDALEALEKNASHLLKRGNKNLAREAMVIVSEIESAMLERS